MLRRRFALFLVLFILCACGGGGGSSLPAVPTVPRDTGASQRVQVSITVPARSAASITRQPQYISSRTQSATIAVNGGAPVVVNLAAGAAGCVTGATGRVCTLGVNAPAGTDVFTEKLYASTDGTGAVLSQGQISAAIVAGKNNTVALTLNGVPASIALALVNPTPVQGTSTVITLTVTVKDASGAAIVGTDALSSAITLSDSDTTKVTSLSKTTLASPADAANLTVTYTGAALASPAVFGATSAGVSASAVTTATLTPQPVNGPVTFNDYTTFGFDNQRTVFNPNTTAFTPAAIAKVHLAWQASLADYNTQTQPILSTGVSGHSGVLYVGGGGSGTIDAYDATTGNVVWSKDLGVEHFNCNGIGSVNFGIGGSAVYDPGSKVVYVVGNSNTTVNSRANNTLFKLDAATGAVLGQVNFSPVTVGPNELNFSHTSVTLGGNGLAYVGTAATCDISSWRGRVAAINVSNMTLANTFFTVWNSPTQPWGGGGVWGWGGVSLDGAGNVYTGVGNTDSGTTNHGTIAAPFVPAPAENSGLGEAFIKLSPDIGTLMSSNQPIPADVYRSTAFAADLDINGTPTIFTPSGVGCPTMASIQGKAGSLYLYDTTRANSAPLASYRLAPATYTDEFLGGAAYSPATGLLYADIPVGAGSLFPPGMLAINPGCGSPTVAWHSTFGPDSDLSGTGGPMRSIPAVSAGGVIFVGTPCVLNASSNCANSPTPTNTVSTQSVRKPSLCCAPIGSSGGSALWALDASTGEVLNGGKPLLATSDIIRVPPTIDGNWVFVLDNGGNLYGLTLDSSFAAVASKYRAPDARAHLPWQTRP